MKNRVKEFADDKKIKFDSLAEKADLSKTTIYSIARGSSVPTIENAYKIAKILGVSIEELFFNE